MPTIVVVLNSTQKRSFGLMILSTQSQWRPPAVRNNLAIIRLISKQEH